MSSNELKSENIPRLISISGSVHSGKTTVSRILASHMPNATYVDGDLISAFVGEKHPQNTSIDRLLPEVHAKIVELVRASLRDGMDCIIDYPVTDKTRRFLVDHLEKIEYRARWFLLMPAIEKVLQGSSTRPVLSEWEIKRVRYHYDGEITQTEIARVIDSTDQTPEETVKIITEEL